MKFQRKADPWPTDTPPMVLEIEGPARSYFDIPLNTFKTPGECSPLSATWTPTDRHVHRVVYISLVQYFDSKPKLAMIGKEVINLVREELGRLGGGIIWWRQRPECQITEDPGRFIWRCRIGTSPSLSPEFWARCGADELLGTASSPKASA